MKNNEEMRRTYGFGGENRILKCGNTPELQQRSQIHLMDAVMWERIVFDRGGYTVGVAGLDIGSHRLVLVTNEGGNMEEALDSSLLREIGEGDEPSANVKVVVERFLVIGVLCTHAMVSVRPTILDAI
ncbi:probable receptor-like protein kinase At1g11050 [Camellia sinensis]|uniref:probable receptor-like protein kinase At1g11050 n=1 Tax=Camellia sinensis TaxID=4442 RepID=UPI0010358600|nr:probable receptor-like protein kinase At1g11050 [Camellia sinensis]